MRGSDAVMVVGCQPKVHASFSLQQGNYSSDVAQFRFFLLMIILPILEPSPCLSACLFGANKDLAISHCTVGRKSGVHGFSGRTFCQLEPQKDDYQSAFLIILFFGVPNP